MGSKIADDYIRYIHMPPVINHSEINTIYDEIDKVLNTILNESIELPEVLVQGLTNNSSKVKKDTFFCF